MNFREFYMKLFMIFVKSPVALCESTQNNRNVSEMRLLIYFFLLVRYKLICCKYNTKNDTVNTRKTVRKLQSWQRHFCE